MQTPTATYRIQLHAGFTFKDLDAILEYLHGLGISTIYASPLTQSFRGSTHGYDTINPLVIDPDIGTEKEWEALTKRLRSYGMNWLQDIVPNHMAFHSSNPWLYDVLKNGQNSPFHDFFDIDWEHPDPELHHRLMAPFLGDSLSACLEKGEIKLEPAADDQATAPDDPATQSNNQNFVLRYHDNVYPVDPSTLEPTATPFPPASLPSPAELVARQHYALTDSRLAATKINYRRFFTVNSLICLRMEDEKVFAKYHERLHAWYEKGLVQGLRIDHIDGLADPGAYTQRLKQLFGADCYIVAEKILQADEPLPAGWSLEGTSGYEFLFLVNQLLADQQGSRKLLAFYRQLVPATPHFEEIQITKKYDFLKTHMAGELDNLVRQLIGGFHFHQMRPDQAILKEALALLMACFPVYRVYPGENPLAGAEKSILESAFLKARQKDPTLTEAFTILQGLFETRSEGQNNPIARAFRTRLMQFTGPLAAKGIEDTAFYTFDPLISHNEVGDTPGIQGIGTEAFHERMSRRQSTLPLSLNATSTHDTKRGEDARIRLDLLTSIPDEWMAAVRTWQALNRRLIKEDQERQAPTLNDEYFIYQSLLGGLPPELAITDEFRDRFSQFLLKALREAKAETNWDTPDESYEENCLGFASALLKENSPFLQHFLPFADKIIQNAAIYSLSQLLIKLTAPGIPDIYQGAECWDLNFVDPDNRRPVDYDYRKALLKNIREHEKKGIPALFKFLSSQRATGAEKMFVIQKTLAYRNKHSKLFTEGEYLPLKTGPRVVAYLRRHEKDWLLVCVPLISMVEEKGRVMYIPSLDLPSLDLPASAPVNWKNEFTGETFQEGGPHLSKNLFAAFPVILLSGIT
jgi:(1->4)-alpha-D-glucan 1-alpha-D-glucosylmutase